MKYARLAIEANGRTMKLAFHPRLTVITGVGSSSRESLVQELIGGLSTNRSGTHLEVLTDGGRSLTVFRPPDAPHRVIDMATGADVSEEYRSTSGTIDLLAHYGLDAATARRWMRVGPNDLVATTHSQQLIARMARIDQSELWSAAQRVHFAELAVAEEVEAEPVEDESLTERIDSSYQSLDEMQEQAEKTRMLAVAVGTIGLLAAALIFGTSAVAAAVLLVIAAAATATAFLFRARASKIDRELKAALHEAGSDSYLGYHLSRIDTYVSGEHSRRHKTNAIADAREAAARWKLIAGDIAVSWAMEHRPAIEAAARLRTTRPTSSATDAGGALVPTRAEDETPELIESLLARLGRVRQLGQGEESFPLLLDEPFGTLDPTIRPALLEVLVHQSGAPQIILLTNEEDVVAWARLEALTGALSFVGPGEGMSPSGETPGSASQHTDGDNDRVHPG